MNLYLGVIFFCVNGQCVFWKSNDLFYSEVECTKVVLQAAKELEKQKIENASTCLKITTKNNT